MCIVTIAIVVFDPFAYTKKKGTKTVPLGALFDCP